MPIVDLSHVINPNTTMFPGTEKPVFQRLEIEGYPEVKITMYTHTGTHIDAPIHILKDAKCLDDFSIDKFVGKGVVINCKGLTGKSITVDHLKKYEHKIKDAEFILLNSGWSSRWYSDEYFEDFPTLTAEAAEWLK